MSSLSRSGLTLFTLLACLASQCAHAADEEVDAITPYRPSVSNAAQLPVAGQLELEMGINSSKTGPALRQSLPYLFKLAFSKEWGILLGGEAHIISDDGAGQRDRGFGDTTFTIKRAFVIDEATAFGLEFGNKFPTAKDALGSGKSDWTVNGIISQDMGKVHGDLNLNLTHLGFAEDATSHWQTGLSTSLSTEVTDKMGLTAEWAGWRRVGTKSQKQALIAFTYSPNKRLTLDAGMIKGLNTATLGRVWFAGVVVPVARLW
ncbi:transporter [Undibacterium pigrum]|uniref:Outer membrane putative beta-barrel porin/alpha-amylase n=1 Tax=Undibacterium pigrum TaxID=401470 RepID=A0A318IWY6_9BURK|nr:transporter [Undibacterium pigrum]PXX34965.1 outer membrane putative beta-barrel porin/alpha-amylase [Undibacterium pigrum]